MNNKKVVIIVGAIVVLFLGVSVFVTLKNKLNVGASAKVDIKCGGSDTLGELKEQDTFQCNVLNKNYTFTVNSIKDNKIVIKASDTGLTEKKSDGTISLLDKKDTFEIEKGTSLTLCAQVTDARDCSLTIEWK